LVVVRAAQPISKRPSRGARRRRSFGAPRIEAGASAGASAHAGATRWLGRSAPRDAIGHTKIGGPIESEEIIIGDRTKTAYNIIGNTTVIGTPWRQLKRKKDSSK